jgi:DNA invertase Pin-like site-specific DNA recombinase
LVHHAHQLGFSQVVVIDEDLGRSGSGVERRPGFDQLVAAVCAGQVGAVVALEAARLARNNREWHHLVDLCALTETVVVDLDGIYDPRLVNDRLLLGLKGTMSEFELTLLRQRAQEALRQKIQRGAVLTEVPVGYVRTEDQRIELTPDRQVQQAIRRLFTQFETLGSARQVLLWYRHHHLPLPVTRPGSAGKEVEWRPPGLHRVLAVLKNPCYAGAFAYGRRQTKTVPEGDPFVIG